MAIERLELDKLYFRPQEEIGLLPRVTWIERLAKDELPVDGSLRPVWRQEALIFKQVGTHIEDGILQLSNKIVRRIDWFQEGGQQQVFGIHLHARCRDMVNFTLRCAQDERTTPQLIGAFSGIYEALYYQEINNLAIDQDMMQEHFELG